MPNVKNFNLPPEMAVNVEVWQSAVLGETYVKRVDQHGNVTSQRVQGHGTVSVTPYERRIHESAVADQTLNPYRNGRLTPVRLLDEEPDTASLQANPNAMSETAMKALFNSQIRTFTNKVGDVTNPITLRRLREVADEVDAKASQIKVIEARMEASAPSGFTKVRVNSDLEGGRGTPL